MLQIFSQECHSSLTIKDGKVHVQTRWYEETSSSIVSKDLIINIIPQPFFEYDYDSNLRNEARNKMSFIKSKTGSISDFQAFNENYAIFPETMQGPKKMLCNIEDVLPILIHYVVLLSLFNSIQCEDESRKRSFLQNNLCSSNMYISIKPSGTGSIQNLVYKSIVDGFLSLFQVFRSSYFTCPFPIDERIDILSLLFIQSDKVLLDSIFRRYVCLIEAKKFASVQFTVKKITLDNATNLNSAFIMRNWIGSLNFLPFCCQKHSHYNYDGTILTIDFDAVLYLSVYPGFPGVTCPVCVFQLQNKPMTFDNMKKFYGS